MSCCCRASWLYFCCGCRLFEILPGKSQNDSGCESFTPLLSSLYPLLPSLTPFSRFVHSQTISTSFFGRVFVFDVVIIIIVVVVVVLSFLSALLFFACVRFFMTTTTLLPGDTVPVLQQQWPVRVFRRRVPSGSGSSTGRSVGPPSWQRLRAYRVGTNPSQQPNNRHHQSMSASSVVLYIQPREGCLVIPRLQIRIRFATSSALAANDSVTSATGTMTNRTQQDHRDAPVQIIRRRNLVLLQLPGTSVVMTNPPPASTEATTIAATSQTKAASTTVPTVRPPHHRDHPKTTEESAVSRIFLFQFRNRTDCLQFTDALMACNPWTRPWNLRVQSPALRRLEGKTTGSSTSTTGSLNHDTPAPRVSMPTNPEENDYQEPIIPEQCTTGVSFYLVQLLQDVAFQQLCQTLHQHLSRSPESWQALQDLLLWRDSCDE